MNHHSKPKRTKFWRAAIFAVINGGAVLLVVPQFIVCGGRASGAAQRNACIYNLCRIEDVKRQWGFDNHKTDGDAIMPSEIDNYIKGGHPSCPAGGTYDYGKTGEAPKCNIKRHELPN
jgi:hypothetical protein